MAKNLFVTEFIRHPRRTGAIAPSSPELARNILKGVDFNNCQCIVEYGPGTGVFTERIVKKKNPDTLFLALESNPRFCESLRKKYYEDKNVIVINDSAENLQKYLDEYHLEKVDYIVSGLPFTSLPPAVSERILSNTTKILGTEGKFITFQYTLFKKGLFEHFFADLSTSWVMLNIPPAFVLECRNRK